MIFSELVNEVKRRATKNESGTQFDSAVNNSINASVLRIAREANWRVLRRTSKFTTVKPYSTGSGSGTFTSGSNQFVITGANFWTNAVDIGRRIKISGDSYYYTIKQFDSNTSCKVDKTYYNTTVTTTGRYQILGQEEYNLPIQSSHRMFLYHNEYGYPYKLEYLTEQDFRDVGIIDTTQGIPTHYRMWGEDMVERQLVTESNISVVSSNKSDSSVNITVFGTVAGYPDSETIAIGSSSGTTANNGTKVFSMVERISKHTLTYGRVSITANNSVTIATIPAGDNPGGVLYKKVRLYPLPEDNFDINVCYYKDPFRLVNAGDVHELGNEFDEAIILLSTAKIKYEADQVEGDRFLTLYTDEVRNLRKTNIDKLDFFPTLRGPNQGRSDLFAPGVSYKQVGPYFGKSSRL